MLVISNENVRTERKETKRVKSEKGKSERGNESKRENERNRKSERNVNESSERSASTKRKKNRFAREKLNLRKKEHVGLPNVSAIMFAGCLLLLLLPLRLRYPLDSLKRWSLQVEGGIKNERISLARHHPPLNSKGLHQFQQLPPT